MSCSSNTPNINKTFIIEPATTTPIMSACTTLYTNELSECTGDTITFNSNLEIVDNIIPSTDLGSDIGTGSRRFREINSYSGNTTIWVATQEVSTPNLDLGLDSESNSRIITADNSIIENDTLLGGTY